MSIRVWLCSRPAYMRWEGTGDEDDGDRDDEVDEDGEDKEMDDKERMRDLAPVSLWQEVEGEGGGRGALATISGRALCAASSTYIHRNTLN